MKTMKELINKLREADHAYYDLDEPIMSDREYNQLFEELEQIFLTTAQFHWSFFR